MASIRVAVGIEPEDGPGKCVLSRLDLTPVEQQLVMDTRDGELCDLRPGEKIDAAEGYGWGRDRVVRAEVIVALVAIGCCEDHPVHYRGLRLRGALITDMLDLMCATLAHPLWLDECYFEKPVALTSVDAKTISLEGSCVPRVDAAWLTTVESSGYLNFERLRASGTVNVACAHIGGYLSLSGAELRADVDRRHGVALKADGLAVDGSVYAQATKDNRRFTAKGQVNLVGAHIGGDLDLTGANLTATKADEDNGIALMAHGLIVDGSVYAQATKDNRRFTAKGQVNLVGAHIGGLLNLSGASLTAARAEDDGGAVALLADRLAVKGSGYMRAAKDKPFTVNGHVSLLGAHIGGQLDLSGAKVSSGALQGYHLRVDQALFLEGATIGNWADLSAASVASLEDDDKTAWPGDVRLDGFTYETLPETRDPNPSRDAIGRRIDWVRGSDRGYTPGPWEQLRRVYRQAGMASQAQLVGMEQQRVRLGSIAGRAKKAGRRWYERAVYGWSWLLDSTVGYGFRTWRVLRWLASVYAAGLVVFLAAWIEGGILPVSDTARVFAVGWYTLDVLVPLIDLGQQKMWLPNPGAFPTPWAGWLVVGWYWVTIIAGWLLGTVAVAGLTGVIRRD